MMVQIKRQIISYNNPGTPLNPIGIVLHETATPNATAQDEFRYFNSANRDASAHAFVDCNEIVQCIDWNKKAWHAGQTANSKYIGIEMCHFDDYRFNAMYRNTIDLIAYIFVNVLNIKTVNNDNLLGHIDVSHRWGETTHEDPFQYLKDHSKTMDTVRKDVQKTIDSLLKPKEPPKAHWAEKYFNYLTQQKGIVINDKRFDDKISRGEVFALMARQLGYKE